MAVRKTPECLSLEWDNCPAGCDCDMDIAHTVCWDVSKSGPELTVDVSNRIDSYDASNMLVAGYEITSGGTHRIATGTAMDEFRYTCAR